MTWPMLRWCVVLFLGAMSVEARGQLPRALTEGMRLTNQVSRALALQSRMQKQVLEVALQGDACLAHWKAFRDSAEASSMPEAELLELIASVHEEVARCRTERQDNIRNLLPDSLKMRFNSLDEPALPNVLHFGLHNRMDCNVCVTPKPSRE
jgi:uncharacterized UBP type Zn finger protein